MGYFRELPNLLYPSFLKDKNSSLDYLEVKNLFRRVKLRDDLRTAFTMFDKYEIPEGYRPEVVAEEIYGSPEFDWVVIITAGIINIRDEWPLNNRDLYEYASGKYGTDLNAVRYYETTEVKDTNGRLILPKGKAVDNNFTIPKPGEPTATLNPVSGVSNYDYETRLNDEKRNINLLRQSYLQEFVNDMRKIMIYGKSSQYIDEDTIQTENIRVTMP